MFVVWPGRSGLSISSNCSYRLRGYYKSASLVVAHQFVVIEILSPYLRWRQCQAGVRYE